MGGGLQPPHQMPTSPLVSGHLAGPSVGPVLGALSSHSKHPSRPHRAGLAQAAVQSSSWGCRRPLGPPSAPVLGSLDMGLSVWGSHLPETAVGRTWVLEAVLVPSSHFWARDPSRAGSPHPRRGSGWRQEGFHGRWVRSALGKGQALCFCSGPPDPASPVRLPWRAGPAHSAGSHPKLPSPKPVTGAVRPTGPGEKSCGSPGRSREHMARGRRTEAEPWGSLAFLLPPRRTLNVRYPARSGHGEKLTVWFWRPFSETVTHKQVLFHNEIKWTF